MMNLETRLYQPRAHRVPHSQNHTPENSTDWLNINGLNDSQYTLHVHQAGLIDFLEAEEIAGKRRPGYKVLGLELCDPPLDQDGNTGYFIFLRPNDAGEPYWQ